MTETVVSVLWTVTSDEQVLNFPCWYTCIIYILADAVDWKLWVTDVRKGRLNAFDLKFQLDVVQRSLVQGYRTINEI